MESSRMESIRNIFNNPWQLLAKYFLSVLQIDFRYAFPANERWFIRFSINRESTSGRTIRKLPFTNRIGLGVLDNLLRANIFSARPTHLSPTPGKETRKSAVYQLARTYTQRPWHSAKTVANADDNCSKKTGK